MIPSPSSEKSSAGEPAFSFAAAFPVTLLFALTLWFFGPAQIYFTNSLEFNFSFTMTVPYLAAAVVITMALCLLLLKVSGRRFYPKGAAVLTALSVALWLQGNLMVWNYGPLDGRDIDWGSKLMQGLFDGGIWILLILFALVKSRFVLRIARHTAFALIAMQLISVGMAVMQAPETPSFKRFYIDDSTKYSFSPQKNVIILMLDTFQTDVFQEIVNEEDYYQTIFRDFTYFRNTLAVFPKTYTSVSSFLTGRYYDNSVPMQDFIRDAYSSGVSLPEVLKKQGYRVELFPYPGTEKTIHFSEAVASNIKPRAAGRVIRHDVAFLADISWFRYLPHFVKPFVYNDQAWLLKRFFSLSEGAPSPASGGGRKEGVAARTFSKDALQRMFDVRFIRDMLRDSQVGDRTFTFKYYHLNGLHRPLVLDGKLELRKMSYSERSSFKTQGKACLEITKLFLDKLKELDVYDHSLIIVMADHGSADYPYGVAGAAGLDKEPTVSGQAAPNNQAAPNSQAAPVPAHVKAAGLPMLLIKPAGSRAETMAVSDAPVSLSDLPPTLFSLLEIPAPEDRGRNAFDLEADETRTRRFYYYNWNGWGDGYLYHMQEYLVDGHAWLDASWRPGAVKKPANADKPYVYGEVIRFGRGGNAMRYQGIGWHGPGKNYTWTREKTAGLHLKIAPASNDLRLRLELRPYLVAGKLPKQEIRVRVNGETVKTLELTRREYGEYEIVIPNSRLSGARLDIILDIPTASAPTDLGVGDDVRYLGAAVRSMVLEPVNGDR